MDNGEAVAQGERNIPFLLAVLVRQFWSGIHELPCAFYRELITQITEIPKYVHIVFSPNGNKHTTRNFGQFSKVLIFLFFRWEKKC